MKNWSEHITGEAVIAARYFPISPHLVRPLFFLLGHVDLAVTGVKPNRTLYQKSYIIFNTDSWRV